MASAGTTWRTLARGAVFVAMASFLSLVVAAILLAKDGGEDAMWLWLAVLLMAATIALAACRGGWGVPLGIIVGTLVALAAWDRGVLGHRPPPCPPDAMCEGVGGLEALVAVGLGFIGLAGSTVAAAASAYFRWSRRWTS